MKVPIGKNFEFNYPLKIEGKGKIQIGDNVILGSEVAFLCAEKSQLKINSNSMVGRSCTLKLGTGVNVIVGHGVSLGEYTSLLANRDWRIGDSVTIATYCKIFSREKGFAGNFIVNDKSNIGDFSILDVSGDITIGSNVAIGPQCIFYTHDHDYNEKGLTVPWRGRPVVKSIRIEDNVWIGSRVTILPGVTIGVGSIIAAGSVVTKDIPSHSLYAGVPAKFIKQIGYETLNEHLIG